MHFLADRNVSVAHLLVGQDHSARIVESAAVAGWPPTRQAFVPWRTARHWRCGSEAGSNAAPSVRNFESAAITERACAFQRFGIPPRQLQRDAFRNSWLMTLRIFSLSEFHVGFRNSGVGTLRVYTVITAPIFLATLSVLLFQPNTLQTGIRMLLLALVMQEFRGQAAQGLLNLTSANPSDSGYLM